MTSRRVVTPPSIDGALTDAAWKRAAASRITTQRFPDAGKPATYETVIRVLHDDKALYIAAHLRDRAPRKIAARVARRDREVESDWFRIEIDSRRDGRGGHFFAVNPAGVKLDGRLYDENKRNSDWDGVWEAATRVTAGGWNVEIAIPLRLLRFQPSEAVSFGVNFTRRISRLAEEDEWQPIPPESNQRVSRFGLLQGLDLKRQPLSYELTPFVSGRLDIRSGRLEDDPARVLNAGLDGKLGLGGNVMLTFTANPDFGQVESDQLVLNLSTIETYLSEKRSFFLEDRSLFEVPAFGDGGPRGELLYTRRIGRAPRSPALADGEALVQPARPPRIWGAVKLAGRTSGRLSVGLLQALTSQEEAQVQLGTGAQESRLAEPLTSFSVLRVRQGFAGGSTVGLMATATAAHEGGAALTGGLDLGLDLLDGRYNVSLQTQLSYLTESRFAWHDSFTRAGLEQDGPFGYSGRLTLWKKGGEHLVGAVGALYRSPSLALNDVGYLDRPDLLMGFVWVQLRHLRPFGPVNRLYLNTNAWVYRNTELTNLGDGWNINGKVVFKNNWSSGFWARFNPDQCDDRETRSAGEVLLCSGRYSFAEGVWLRTDSRRAVQVGLQARHSTTERGHSLRAALPVTIAPLPRLQVEVSPSYQRTSGDVRWIKTDSGRAIFGERSTELFDVTLRVSYAFRPELTLQAYGQLMLAEVDYGRKLQGPAKGRLDVERLEDAAGVADEYDFASTDLSLGAVLRWEYLPGSTGYLVYSSRMEELVGASGTQSEADHTVMLKLSYLFG